MLLAPANLIVRLEFQESHRALSRTWAQVQTFRSSCTQQTSFVHGPSFLFVR
jgi:hypothetical protein